jgi:hypothetical protein
MRARIVWVSPVDGGRSSLPTGERYVTVARFPEDGERWHEEAWSVVVEASPSPAEQGNPTVGDARFLVDDAPLERLRPGRSFDLYEGARRVATVDLI